MSKLDHQAVASDGERTGELLAHLGLDVELLGGRIEVGDVEPAAARLARDAASQPRGQMAIAITVRKCGLEEVVIDGAAQLERTLAPAGIARVGQPLAVR